MTLRSYLLALVTIALVPVLTVSGLAVREALSAYQRSFEDRLLDTSRALAAAVERNFAAHVTALATLATNPLLDLDEHGAFAGPEGFHERMVRAAAVIRAPVVLVARDGRNILHSARPFGTALPMTGTPDAVRRTIETGRPLVGDLGFGAVSTAPIIPVLVPVMRDMQVVAALGAPVPPERVSELLAGQGLSAGRFAVVVDGKGVIVARSARSAEAVGRRASDWYMQGAAGREGGILQGQSATTGEQVVVAFRKLAFAPGWTVLVGEPSAVSASEIRRPLLAFVVGGGTVILLALACAAWIGRRVLRDVSMLERQAQRLAAEDDRGDQSDRGDRGNPGAKSAGDPPLGEGITTVSEFVHLGQAMLRANQALRDREERQMLLVREVDHRAKNALAVVQAMVRLTPSADPKDFQHAIQGRVDALARTHSTLARRGWQATDLSILLEAELAPYRGAASLSGPPIAVTATAAQPIAMVVHELATNAAKHGALSMPGGTVLVTWSVDGDDLQLRWTEQGGPPTGGPPVRRGFGTRMIEANVRGQLGGTLRTVWDPSFVCEMSVPLTRILGSEADPRAAWVAGGAGCTDTVRAQSSLPG